MFLPSLNIENFKNLISVNLDFTSKYVCFTGDNGAGKTNLLDAIHYISIGKSYFNSIDSLNVNHDANYFNIKGKFKKNNDLDEIFCAYMHNKKKAIKKNNIPYERLSDHVGEYPVVIITPFDNELIMGGSETRRRFLDIIISQLNKKYLENLLSYARTLKQRNAQLKIMSQKNISDRNLLSVYDSLLDQSAIEIYNLRKSFLNSFGDIFSRFYSLISREKESVTLTYKSQLLEKPLKELLDQNFQRDLLLQRTINGIHRDDIEFSINGYPAKRFASQGQQKSYLLALKFSQYEIIKANKGFCPIMLLDDFFDRLDETRSKSLIDIITNEDFGQVFITDTKPSRVMNIFNGNKSQMLMLKVDNGKVGKC